MNEPRELDWKFAIGQAARLGVFGDFPKGRDVIAEIAEILLAWCTGGIHRGRLVTPEDQCRMLIDTTILQLHSWKGPYQLREILRGLFPEPWRQPGFAPRPRYWPSK
jgi:hypothetical protein